MTAGAQQHFVAWVQWCSKGGPEGRRPRGHFADQK